MKRSRTSILKAGLNALYLSQVHRALAPFTRGLGVIFTLHHVEPGAPANFAPNRILSVTPEFLAAVIERVRVLDIDIVSLDEAKRRVLSDEDERRFVCLTFDDGYRDNLEVAYPVLKHNEAPFTVYVTTGLPDQTAELWWRVLEQAVAHSDTLAIPIAGGMERHPCRSVSEKYATYETLYWRLRALPAAELVTAVRAIARHFGIEMKAMARKLSMTWEEIRELARDPLVTIGAHTVSHPALAKLRETEVDREMAESRRRIAEMTGIRPHHFAFPYGDPGSAGLRDFACARRLGFSTAVTTRPGMLFAGHRDHLTALPRVSLNGDYQSLRYVDLFLTGAPFALRNRLRREGAA